MNLQQIIEQYITFQQSLGTAFLTDAAHPAGIRPQPRR